MGPLLVLVSSLLLVVGLRANERLLPQWLTGIIAVSGFLLLAFIAFVVKKLWCEKSSRNQTGSCGLSKKELNLAPDFCRNNLENQ
uniref:Uncharacterized protein n=1 Tax=Oryzias melastigma TaxID=30732 RepID=A0A3B3BH92_ORYME